MHSFIAVATTSTSTSRRCSSTSRRLGSIIRVCRTRCIASIHCCNAFLVGVSWVVALWTEHHWTPSFSFIHVVPDPFLLSSTNALAQFRIWIGYVCCISFGIFNERTDEEMALQSVVPSVQDGLLQVVPRHVPTHVSTFSSETCNEQMTARLV
jgi:hypothetical protein